MSFDDDSDDLDFGDDDGPEAKLDDDFDDLLADDPDASRGADLDDDGDWS